MLIQFVERFLKRFPSGVRVRRPNRSFAREKAALVESLELRQMLSANPILVVNSSGDTDQAGKTTLRDAINQANSDAPGDTITFDPSLSGSTITLTQGQLNLTNSMTITGLGANQLTISGNNASGIIDVSATTASVSLTGVTLTDGNFTQGAAIENSGTLSISNDIISNSGSASLISGAGAILNNGVMTSLGNVISGNEAFTGGGIVNYGTLTSVGDTFSQNTAIGAVGGAINNYGMLTITKDSFTGNIAGVGYTSAGGAAVANIRTTISSDNTFSGNNSGLNSGGAIENQGTFTSTNDTIADNWGLGGAGIFNDGLLTTVNDTIAGNVGDGVVNYFSTWHSLNTIVAGNFQVMDSAGTITATNIPADVFKARHQFLWVS